LPIGGSLFSEKKEEKKRRKEKKERTSTATGRGKTNELDAVGGRQGKSKKNNETMELAAERRATANRGAIYRKPRLIRISASVQ
jgi:hypothetical protein